MTSHIRVYYLSFVLCSMLTDKTVVDNVFADRKRSCANRLDCVSAQSVGGSISVACDFSKTPYTSNIKAKCAEPDQTARMRAV